MARPGDIACSNRTAAWWSKEWIAGSLISLIFGFAFCYPMFGHFGQVTLSLDWAFAIDWSWSAWRTISHYHQFPFWNPYKCGGMPSLANPQSHFLSPFLLLRVFLGPVAGLELEVPLHVSVAFAGAYVLARTVKCKPIAAVAAGIVFAGSSWLPLHAAAGHDVFLPAAYMPWVCAFTWIGIQRRRASWAALAGLFVALCCYEGAMYEVLQLAIFVVIMGTIACVMERSPRPMLTVATVGIFFVGFAAFKLFPAIVLMRAHPRLGYLSEESFYKTLLSVFSRKQNFAGPWGEGGFWEHGAYIGAVFAFLGLAGLIKYPARALPWAAAALIFFLLSMGGTSPHSLYVLLHRMPGFESTYAPFRFLIPFVLAVAILSALGTEYILERQRRAALALLAVGLIDAILVSPVSLAEPFTVNTFATPVHSAEFRQYYDSSPSNIGMLPLNMANLGAVNCYEANFWNVSDTQVRGYNQPDYHGEQFLLRPGTVRLLRWTPEKLQFRINTRVPNMLIINQNYYAGWRIRDGTAAIDPGRAVLSVEVPAGSQNLTIFYRAPWAITGIWIFALTTACMGILFWRERFRGSAGRP
ncbi:MAG: hypothetical protein ACYDC3_04330 [Candidatus Binataceae bacterium]